MANPTGIGTIKSQTTDLLKHYNSLMLNDVNQSVKFTTYMGMTLTLKTLSVQKTVWPIHQLET
eukprot:8745179-Ditylum_brightwellii.AAC.1